MKYNIGPATEIFLKQENYERMANQLEKALAYSLKKIKNDTVKELLVIQTEQEIEQLKQGQKPEQVFKYLSFAYENPASLLDYLDSKYDHLY